MSTDSNSKKRKSFFDKDRLNDLENEPPSKKQKSVETDVKKQTERELKQQQEVYIVIHNSMSFTGLRSPPDQDWNLIAVFASLKEANKCAQQTFAKKHDAQDWLYDGAEQDAPNEGELADYDSSRIFDFDERDRTHVWVIKQKLLTSINEFDSP